MNRKCIENELPHTKELFIRFRHNTIIIDWVSAHSIGKVKGDMYINKKFEGEEQIQSNMNKFQLIVLFGLVSLVRGDLSVLQSNALLITIVLSVLACIVPMLCFFVIVCLIVKLILMSAKLRGRGHPVFEELNHNLSLTESTNKEYKRISNVYDLIDTESNVSQHKKSDSSDSIKSNTPINLPCNEGNNQTKSVQEDRDFEQALKLSFPDAGNGDIEDESVYVVMTTRRKYDEGPEEITQTFD